MKRKVITRKKVIEEFLNDEVTSLRHAVYKWRGLMYEIIPYKEILHDKTLKASHFVKYVCNGCTYGIRELSQKVFNKRYS